MRAYDDIHVEIPFPYGDSEYVLDEYRSWLEENIGQQKIDWDWGLTNTNIDIKLTISSMYEKEAMMLRIMWS
jgi:hypothetical protein